MLIGVYVTIFNIINFKFKVLTFLKLYSIYL